MSATIIGKCIQELKADTPRIDYVLGMLEAVEAMATDRIENVSVPIAPIFRDIGDSKKLVAEELSDEERLAQEYAGGHIGNIA